MSCWTVLGLSADADTRSIKRQYATLLKQTRPDEDPEGFQRLRDAYEQALQHKEWEQFSEESQGVAGAWVLNDLSVMEVATSHGGTRSLEGIGTRELERQYTAALDHGAVDALENALLRHCVEHPETSQAQLEWAIDTFHWFSAWQRLELDEEQIDLLLELQQLRMVQPLREALEREDSDGFLQAYAQRSQYRWLNGEHHRQWFNRLLSRLLLDSRYWSSAIFEAVSIGQGWCTGAGNTCPDTEWKGLIARHEAPIFIARQQLLATQPCATPEHRAARLLLGPWSFSQRRALARRLRDEDWVQCRQLSSALYANHRPLCEAMPGATPFFWREWEHTFNSWPMYLGIAFACLIGTFVQYAPEGTRLGGLISIAVFWSVIFGIGGAALHWTSHQLAHRWWLLDDQLSARLLPGGNPDSAWFGWLRDLIPGAVMAVGLGYVFGLIASSVYVTTLLAVGLLRRRRLNPRVSWERSSPILKRGLTGAGVLLLIVLLGVLKVISNQGTVNHNQGLQQWAERFCSRMPASSAECSAPATVEQWYGKEYRP
ncbi:J domain-containing protein [Pseudomonas sp. PD9R]|uniref:J domain-containing protein n=1 Tax=Pseudomonas sp. PD9R TaxID=2853534 RepID=UPI001C477434|nr:J domain-containing protein [Pseudomonas sp. PD9R]MBV6822939.1 J domain-containing protein [Pseudomonas sp. PD9R]